MTEELPVCFVCGKVIRENALYIGKDLYRHKSKCKPGSVNWMKNEKLAKLFEE